MAYEELKQRQSKIWGTGPYQRITETITDVHARVVDQLDPRPGVEWLDLACGTGAVAERAAAAGATVTGIDLAPVLIETARERAAERGLEIDYRVGDCERLGDAFELEFEEHVSTLRVPSGEAYWELFSTSYGPTRTLAEALGDRREELHHAWVDFFESNYRSNGEIAHTREYLLVCGQRR